MARNTNPPPSWIFCFLFLLVTFCTPKNLTSPVDEYETAFKKPNPVIVRTFQLLLNKDHMDTHPQDIPRAILVIGKTALDTDAFSKLITKDKSAGVDPGLETGPNLLLYPKLVNDTVNGIKYCILPPIMTDRTVQDDIVASHYSQRMADSIASVKLVVALEYIEHSGSNKEFEGFFHRASQFINGTGFRNHSLLVVFYSGSQNDSVVLAAVRSALEYASGYVSGVTRSGNLSGGITSEQQLIQGFLIKKERIHVIRNDESSTQSSNNVKISELLNSIEYTNPIDQEIEFGHLLNENSLRVVTDFLVNSRKLQEYALNQTFIGWTRQLKGQLLHGFGGIKVTNSEGGSPPSHLTASQKILAKHSTILSRINGSSSEEIVDLLSTPQVQELVTIPNSLLREIVRGLGPLQFYSDLIQVDTTAVATGWGTSLNGLLTLVHKENKWFKFLTTMKHRIESGEWKRAIDKREGFDTITRSNYQQPLELFNLQGGRTTANPLLKRVSNVTARRVLGLQMVMDMNSVLADMNNSVTHECGAGDILIIWGKTIVLDSSNTSIFKLCNNETRTNNIVLATDTVIIRNFSFVGGLGEKKFVVMAPKVQPEAEALVSLTGGEGAMGDDDPSCYKSAASPGGPGGHFTLITGNLTGDLKVISRGGKGGRGRDDRVLSGLLIHPNGTQTEEDALFQPQWGSGFEGLGGYPGTINLRQIRSSSFVDVRLITGLPGELGSVTDASYKESSQYQLVSDRSLCGTKVNVFKDTWPFNKAIPFQDRRKKRLDSTIFWGSLITMGFNRTLDFFLSPSAAESWSSLLSFYIEARDMPEGFNQFQALNLLDQLAHLFNMRPTNPFFQTQVMEALYSDLMIRILNYTRNSTYHSALRWTSNCTQTCTIPSGKEGLPYKQCLYNGFAYEDGVCYVLPTHNSFYHWGQAYDFNNCLKKKTLTTCSQAPQYRKLFKSPITDVSECLRSGRYWYGTTNHCNSTPPTTLDRFDCTMNGFDYNSNKETVECTSELLQQDYSQSIPFVCGVFNSDVIPHAPVDVKPGWPTPTERQTGLRRCANKDFYDCGKRHMVNTLELECAQTTVTAVHTEEGPEVKKALATAYVAGLGKLNSLKYHNDDFIINVEQFLQNSQTLIVEYQRLEKENENEQKGAAKNKRILEQNKKMEEHIRNASDSYNAEIEKKIAEATHLIKSRLQPVVDETNDKLSDKITVLVSHIQAMIKDAEADKKKVEEAKEAMEAALVSKAIFGGIGVVTGFIGMMGPKGAAVAAVIDVGSSIAQAALGNESNPDGVITAAAENLGKTAEAIETFMSDTNKAENEATDAKIKELENYHDQLSEAEFSEEKKSFKTLKKEYDERNGAKVKDQNALKKKRREIKAEAQKLKKKQGSVDDTQKGLIKKAQIAAGAMSVIESSVKVYQGIKDDEDKIAQADATIHAIQEKIDGLKKMEEKVYSFVGPLLADLQNASAAWSGGNVKDESLASLMVMKFEAQQNIKDTRLQIESFTAVLGNDFGFKQLIEKLDDAMVTTFQIYDQIEKYQENQKFANLIAVLTQPKFADLPNDEATPMGKAVAKLQRAVVSNNIMYVYNKAVAALLQYSFPFAHLLMKDLSLPSDLDFTDTASVVNKTAIHMTVLLQKMKEEKAVIHKGKDDYVFTKLFNDTEHLTAFHRWDGENMANELEKFFNGESIVLSASILDSPIQYDAVKFRTINLEFRVRENETADRLLKDQLKFYKLQMNHTGNSYYRCKNKYYVFQSPLQKIQFSFLIDEKTNKHVETNSVYEKIMEGDVTLSPYTTWVVTLKQGDKSNGFSRLDEFKGNNSIIDVYLWGWGTYVISENLVQENIAEFYTPDETISEMERRKLGRENLESQGRSFKNSLRRRRSRSAL